MHMKRIPLLFASMMVAMTASAQSLTPNYPKAEWDSAKVILMHTPGEELFNGVVHPMAGLFENYFDVDSAANEHRNYIRLLRANGIKVYNVADILQEMNIDTLRSLAGRSLVYDVSGVADSDTAACGQVYKREVLRQMDRDDLIRCVMTQPVVKLRSVGNNTGVEADIYVRQPGTKAYRLMSRGVSFVKFLRRRGFQILQINEADELHYANNYLTIAPAT